MTLPACPAALQAARPQSTQGRDCFRQCLSLGHCATDLLRKDLLSASRKQGRLLSVEGLETKTLSAALNANTRGCAFGYGNSRCLRSISANNSLIVVPRSITINRNCSQNSGSAFIEVMRPSTLTECIFCCIIHTTLTPCQENASSAPTQKSPSIEQPNLCWSTAVRPSKASRQLS